MESQNNTQFSYPLIKWFRIREKDEALNEFAIHEMHQVMEALHEFKLIIQQSPIGNFDELLAKIKIKESKKSFLIFKHQRYFTVPTENTAFFYVRNEITMMTSFEEQEYPVNYSLEQIQNLLPEKQFFRLNRQYLVNFSAIKEVEHYFARKLIVKLVIAASDKLLVSKRKSVDFLKWLEDR